MLTKIALLAFVALMVWRFLAPRARRGGGGSGARALPHPLDLVRCPRCGTHRLPGSPCTCERPDRETSPDNDRDDIDDPRP